VRFLHSSDWHLGRSLHGVSLLPEQRSLLSELGRWLEQNRPHALVLAGDLYDRAVPPKEAVEVLDDFLCHVVLDLKIPVLAIAGNHDSPERLGFASRLLADRGLHLVGPLTPTPHVVTLEDADGPVDFCLLPYASAEQLLSTYPEAPQDATLSYPWLVSRALGACTSARRVLIAHAYVVGGEGSESERDLQLGGASAVPLSTFEGFHYVALGHLHRSQSLDQGRVRYCGTPYPYSFSEVGQDKGFLDVQLDGQGLARAQAVPLAAPRAVRVLRGSLAELVAAGRTDPRREDYVKAELTDQGLILDAMTRLRSGYPNALHIERLCPPEPPTRGASSADPRKLGDLQLFRCFFAEVSGAPPTEEEERLFLEALRATEGGEQVPCDC